MPLPAFNGQVQDLSGNAVADFEVEVRDESDGSLAVIFADRDEVTPLGNPFTPNPLNNGHFTFYVTDGRYRIRSFDSGGNISDWRDVQVGDDIANLSGTFLNEASNLSDVDTPATAFGNIKQTASDSATGVVEKATADEVRSAASDKFISADLIESASAQVNLIDAATIALDWDAGINFNVTITTNRILGNPTNGQPGTWRTVLVVSDGGPDTLTFGNQYGGEVPTIDDVTTTQWYLLMIHCLNSAHFLVSAIDASEP